MSHFRTTPHRVRYHILLYAIVVATLLAGCGGDDDGDSGSPYKLRTTAFRGSELKKPADSGALEVRACRVLSPAFVARSVRARPGAFQPEANNSLDLSICEWHGGRAGTVKLMVDTAPRAQLRYYNLLSEQHEYYNADPARKARQIKGVGQDSAYGGAGAWWTRDRRQLVAYDHDKIFKLRVNVRGFDDHPARSAAVRLAKRAVRRLCAGSRP
jgi:hypothetical protein